MARNTGLHRVNGRVLNPTGPWLWSRYHGGLFGEIPKSCWQLGWKCPHVTGGSAPIPR